MRISGDIRAGAIKTRGGEIVEEVHPLTGILLGDVGPVGKIIKINPNDGR